MADITSILQATQSPDGPARAAAEEQLKSAQDSNYAGFLTSLAGEIANEQKPPETRRLAGLILKNALDARDEVRKAELQEKWLAVDAGTRGQIKAAVWTMLGSSVRAPPTPLSPSLKSAHFPHPPPPPTRSDGWGGRKKPPLSTTKVCQLFCFFLFFPPFPPSHRTTVRSPPTPTLPPRPLRLFLHPHSLRTHPLSPHVNKRNPRRRDNNTQKKKTRKTKKYFWNLTSTGERDQAHVRASHREDRRRGDPQEAVAGPGAEPAEQRGDRRHPGPQAGGAAVTSRVQLTRSLRKAPAFIASESFIA
jgi:hypothetical protein